MTQMPQGSPGHYAVGSQTKRAGPLDVYTGLLLAALLVLAAGFFVILTANMEVAEGELTGEGLLDSVPGFQVVKD